MVLSGTHSTVSAGTTSQPNPAAPAAAPGTTHPASPLEHLAFMAGGLWLMAGLALDGWAHRHQPELETFFTPWHAVFYSGFTAAVTTVAVMVIRRRATTDSLRSAIPAGYELTVVGFALFAVGGIGDGIWHTIFGIESTIDALLSPTHLLMLAGMSIAIAAPIRAAQRQTPLPSLEPNTEPTELDPRPKTHPHPRTDLRPTPDTAPTLGSFLPVVLSLALLTTGVAFFFLYANGFANWPTTNPFRPNESDVLAGYGVLATLASTIILLTPTLYLLNRWRTPFGTFTLLYGIVGVFLAGLDAFAYPWQILAPLAGGLTADLVVRLGASRPRTTPNGPTASSRLGEIVGLAVPLAMWTVSTLALHLAWTIRWPPELWFGQIVMAVLCGYGLALLARPPTTTMTYSG